MQNKVKEFNESKGCHKKTMPVYARILNIDSELGELEKEYLKNSKYGTADFVLTEDFKMEYGDCLYALLSLACEQNLDAEECFNLAINKYKNRIEKNNNMASGK